MATIVYLVRHGITDWNVARRDQGQTDIPLNDTGRSQARALAARFQDEHWDVAYASDLLRAKETAEIILSAKGLPIMTDVRLREIHCGLREGTTEQERIAKWGTDWETLDLGMESVESVKERGSAAVREYVQQHPDKRILVVSHGDLIMHTVARLLGDRTMEGVLQNTAVSILRYEQGEWCCDLYNCARHVV